MAQRGGKEDRRTRELRSAERVQTALPFFCCLLFFPLVLRFTLFCHAALFLPFPLHEGGRLLLPIFALVFCSRPAMRLVRTGAQKGGRVLLSFTSGVGVSCAPHCGESAERMGGPDVVVVLASPSPFLFSPSLRPRSVRVHPLARYWQPVKTGTSDSQPTRWGEDRGKGEEMIDLGAQTGDVGLGRASGKR